MTLIGVTIGLIAWLLKQCLTVLGDLKWNKAKQLAEVQYRFTPKNRFI